MMPIEPRPRKRGRGRAPIRAWAHGRLFIGLRGRGQSSAPKRLLGQSIIEFALLLPILLGLLLGTIDTAMMLSAKSDVAYANRQASRLMEAYGATPSVNPDPTILQALTDALRSSKADINSLQSVTFFKADTAAESQAGDNPANDLVYTYTNGLLVGPPTGAYTYTLRSPGDHVGITVLYRYSGFTPLFAGGFTFSDVTNVQIDPANGSFALPTPIPTPTNPPPSPQATYTPVASPTPLPTYTPQPTYTQPPTSTPTNTPTNTPTSTATNTPTATPTPYTAYNAVASSVESPTTTYTPTNIIDGNFTTRWSSDYVNDPNPDNAWVYVDLGSPQTFQHVTLQWERACGKTYQIRVANDDPLNPGHPGTWTTVYDNTSTGGFTGCGPTGGQAYPDPITLSSSQTARYVEMQGLTRATSWGYSLWEFQVYP